MSTKPDGDETSPALLTRRQVGRLAAVLYLGCAVATLATIPLPQPPGASRTALLGVVSLALVIGSVTLLIPWDRIPRSASLWLVPPALGLIATANAYGGFPFFGFGVCFVVAFVWLGISHRPLVSLAFAPLTAIAYLAPVVVTHTAVGAGLGSALLVVPVCVLVGESLAWVGARFASERGQLARSHERYQKLVELSPNAIFVHAEGRFVFANAAALDLFGAARADQLIGRGIFDVVHPDCQEIVTERVRGALGEGRNAPLTEEQLVRLDGTLIEAEVAATAVEFEGRPAALVVARDVTARKRAERERATLLVELRQANSERQLLLEHLVRAQEEERRRLAGDIHDDTVQVMTVAAMRLDLLQRKITMPELRATVEKTAESVRRATERLRGLVFTLHPSALETGGLAAAIQSFARADQGSGTRPEVVIEDRLPREPPEELRTVAYRIAQEALANVFKHASATVVRVIIAMDDSALTVRIEDDGVGFQAGPELRSSVGHLGLTAMRERAQLVGGELTIAGGPGGGTVVEYRLPLRGELRGQASEVR